MNCKPGDIARVVSGGANRDALLRVLDFVNCDPGEWRCEALQSMAEYKWTTIVGRVPAGTIVYAMDSILRPIRDPGDDAVDETLSWLPAPSAEKETV